MDKLKKVRVVIAEQEGRRFVTAGVEHDESEPRAVAVKVERHVERLGGNGKSRSGRNRRLKLWMLSSCAKTGRRVNASPMRWY
jgi:hypothetical protein